MLANFVVSLSFSLPSVLQPLLLLQPSIIEAPIGGALGSLYQVPDQSLHCCERKEEAYFFLACAFRLIGAYAVEQKKSVSLFP